MVSNFVCIEPASNKHLPNVVLCHNQSVHQINRYSESQKRAWLWDTSHVHRLQDKLSDKRWSVLVATDQDKMIKGFAIADTEEKTIEAIYVTSTRAGTGSVLLSAIEAIIGNAIRVCSTVNAVDFYKQHGFKKEKNDTVEINGVSFDVVLLGKSN